jgi:hypothetical protein
MDKAGDFYCPKCDNGYTWSEGECMECADAIEGCLTCDFRGTCRKCDEGYFLSLDRSSCIEEFINCENFEPSEYIQKSTTDFMYTEWACPVCDFGFYFDLNFWDCVGQCTDFDSEATDCDEWKILTCSEDYMISPDNLSC